MVYEDFKDTPGRAASDKVLRDKTYNVHKNSKYNRYKRGLALMVYEFFDEKFSGTNTSGGAVKNETMSNQHPSEKDDAIYHRIRYLISKKVVLHMFFS